MCPDTEAPGNPARRLGSYTTAKISGGRVERLERHTARLRRDAERLGLSLPQQVDVERIFLDTAERSFGSSQSVGSNHSPGRRDGIIRVEWSHLPGAPPKLIATPREYQAAAPAWSVVTSDAIHPGPEFRANTKYVDVAAYDLGRDYVKKGDVDEVMLFDAQGRLVEGAHSNFIVVTEAGHLVTPARDLGCVEGLGLTIVREGHPEIREAHLTRTDLDTCREMMSTNAVRGVVPIISIDDKPVPAGEIAKALGAAFCMRSHIA